MLVTLLLSNAGLDLVDHRARVRKAGADARKEKVEREAAAVKLMQEGALQRAKKRLKRIGECGI